MLTVVPNLIELAERLERVETQLAELRRVSTPASYYSVAEFAKRVGRASYTVRNWARRNRILATRRASGGVYRPWVISHSELVRYQQWGLLPEES